MAKNFDWYAEEDRRWEDGDPTAGTTGEAALRPSQLSLPWVGLRGGTWLFLVLVLLALSLVVVVVTRRLNQQVEAVTTAVTADVRTTHALIQQAATQRDLELFHTLLSGRDPAWAATQKQLVVERLFLDRAPFGLMLQQELQPAMGSSEEPLAVTITLSPQLTAAEVTFAPSYNVVTGEGVTATVQLQQTAVYRLGGEPRPGAGRWLLAPPEREFWGDWSTRNGRMLTIAYPERDAAIAERLAADLDMSLAQMCRQLSDLHCPAGWRADVRLSTDPASLLTLADPTAVLRGALTQRATPWLELPAPTLVGRPLDEAGYQALARGYQVLLVSAAITHLVGYRCCEQGLLYRALLDKQLSWLGLQPWPLTSAEYNHLLAGPFRPAQIRHVWERPLDSQTPLPANDWQAPYALIWQAPYALIDFMLAEAPDNSAADMQRQLAQAPTFADWLGGFLPYTIGSHRMSASFINAWLHFVDAQSSLARVSPPPPLPTANLQFVCQTRPRFGIGIYRYDVAAETWSTIFMREPGRWMSLRLLPGQPDFVKYERTRFSLQRPDGEVVLWQSPTLLASPWVFTEPADPNGRYLVVANYPPGGTGDFIRLLDLATCRPDDCQLQPLAGWPIWSPDSRQTLISVDAATLAAIDETSFVQTGLVGQPLLLYRGDAMGQRSHEIGAGLHPFWLDAAHYGYVRMAAAGPGSSPAQELVLANTADDHAHPLLNTADLLTAIAQADGPAIAQADGPAITQADDHLDDQQPHQLWLQSIKVAPVGQRTLALTAVTALDEQTQKQTTSYIFLIDLAADETSVAAWQVTDVTLLLQVTEPARSVFSPDGRWLLIHHGTTATLFDLANGARRQSSADITFSFAPLWSPDGEWLLQAREGYLLLTALASGYQRLISHDFAHCFAAVWVEENSNQ